MTVRIVPNLEAKPDRRRGAGLLSPYRPQQSVTLTVLRLRDFGRFRAALRNSGDLFASIEARRVLSRTPRTGAAWCRGADLALDSGLYTGRQACEKGTNTITAFVFLYGCPVTRR
jgi:hypothetical protein